MMTARDPWCSNSTAVSEIPRRSHSDAPRKRPGGSDGGVHRRPHQRRGFQVVKRCRGVCGDGFGRLSGSYEVGKKITGLGDAGKLEGVKVFHSGTSKCEVLSTLPRPRTRVTTELRNCKPRCSAPTRPAQKLALMARTTAKTLRHGRCGRIASRRFAIRAMPCVCRMVIPAAIAASVRRSGDMQMENRLPARGPTFNTVRSHLQSNVAARCVQPPGDRSTNSASSAAASFKPVICFFGMIRTWSGLAVQSSKANVCSSS